MFGENLSGDPGPLTHPLHGPLLGFLQRVQFSHDSLQC
jgi:hypothetical protein